MESATHFIRFHSNKSRPMQRKEDTVVSLTVDLDGFILRIEEETQRFGPP